MNFVQKMTTKLLSWHIAFQREMNTGIVLRRVGGFLLLLYIVKVTSSVAEPVLCSNDFGIVSTIFDPPSSFPHS